MLWMNEEVETTGTAVVDAPAVEPVLGVLDEESAEEKETDNGRLPWSWADVTETGPVVVLDARDPDEEEEEEEEEDADFFDDEEEEDDDLDDDMEGDDFEEEEFEEDDDEDEEDDDDDL